MRPTHLVDSLDTTVVGPRQVDVIDEELKTLAVLGAINEALAVEDIGLDEVL